MYYQFKLVLHRRLIRIKNSTIIIIF